jgi:heterodisulfide reductase subunit B
LKAANREYKGTIDIEHFVVTLAETVGLDHIKGFITRSLEGVKVALHPGCHYARPSHILKVEEDVFDLKNLRNLAKLTGVEVVDYEQENLCCGNVERQTDEYTANMMLKSKFDSAIAAGAEMFLVNCPACFQQFDGEQRRLIKLEEGGKLKYKVPILYITELLALAMGASPDEIGLKFHRNKPKNVLAKVNL